MKEQDLLQNLSSDSIGDRRAVEAKAGKDADDGGDDGGKDAGETGDVADDGGDELASEAARREWGTKTG
jgi:hypothetical protein